MKGNKGRDTRPEIALRSALFRMGLRYRCHYPIRAAGRRYRPDIVFTAAKVCVQCQGCYWHRCPQHGTMPKSNRFYWEAKLTRNVERDRESTRALEEEGWTVIRVWEHEDPLCAADRIASEVRRRRPLRT